MRSVVRQTGSTVLLAGCLIGVVAGSALVAAIFKPDTPFAALLIGAGGFVAVVGLVIFGSAATPPAARPEGAAATDPEGTIEFDAMSHEDEPHGLPEPEPEAEVEPAPLTDPLGAPADDETLTVTRAEPALDGIAALHRATELKDGGDIDGAIAIYREVVASDDAMAGAAALNLGVLLAKQGDLDGAQDAYGQAVERGGSVAKSAQVLLDLLAERRRVSA
jgi:hypothetical protein